MVRVTGGHMASVTNKLQHTHEACRNVAPPKTRQFEAYNLPYQALLTELQRLGGEEAMNELVAWITAQM